MILKCKYSNHSAANLDFLQPSEIDKSWQGIKTLVRALPKAAMKLRKRALNWGEEDKLWFWPCLHLVVVCMSAKQQCEHQSPDTSELLLLWIREQVEARGSREATGIQRRKPGREILWRKNSQELALNQPVWPRLWPEFFFLQAGLINIFSKGQSWLWKHQVELQHEPPIAIWEFSKNLWIYIVHPSAIYCQKWSNGLRIFNHGNKNVANTHSKLKIHFQMF